MIIDGRTREGKEQEVINQVKNYGGFTIFWVTQHQSRACAAVRLVDNGTLKEPESGKGEYPWCAWELNLIKSGERRV
jgi:hypothetical protein